MAQKMTIFSRMQAILASNINAVLDKMEDPSKMVDQLLVQAKNDLADVKNATAEVMAQETKTLRLRDDAAAEVDKYDKAARNAVAAGNDDDARKLLEAKQKAVERLNQAEATYAAAKKNADTMRATHNKLVSDIDDLERRKANVKANVAVAKAQTTVNDFADAGSKSLGAFSRMEEKSEQMRDRANAEAELNEVPADSAEGLAAKYSASSTSVDDELAKLKAEMGK